MYATHILQHIKIVVATCYMSGMEYLKSKYFDYVLIDEGN